MSVEDAPRSGESLAELIGDYDAIVCDIWGVVHDGRTVLPGAPAALRAARAAGLPVVLVSNVPRTSLTVPDALRRVGVPDDAWDAIVTSGDVTRAELARRSPGPVHRIGRETDASLWSGLGLEFSGMGPARFMAIAGLDPDEEPDDYDGVLRRARARDLELVCANPDIQVPAGPGLAWTAGSVAVRYRVLGGRVVAPGKPEGAIYERVRSVVDRLRGRATPAGRILAIGDGIPTDVRGANRAGMDCLFVATGLNRDTLLAGDGRPDLGKVQAALAAAGARAKHVLAELV